MKNKIFLGGTCAQTDWREKLIPLLNIDFFNPVVEDWTPEFQQEEIIEKEYRCNIHLYYITSKMQGVFSIAEAVDSSHKSANNTNMNTILYVDPNGFSESQLKSLKATINLVTSIGGIASFESDIKTVANNINNLCK